MKKTTRVFTLIVTTMTLTFSTGCVQMILDAHKKLEPMAFNVLPPSEDDFVMLLPDAEINSKIVGTWHGNVLLKGYSALDMNQKPFMYINAPDTTGEETYTFNADGTLKVSMLIRTTNPQTQQVTENQREFNGTWLCKDGLIYLKTKTVPNNEEGSATAVVFWDDNGNMEFRADVESLKNETLNKIMGNAQTRESVKDMNFYYDKEGNFYTVLVIETTHGNMNSHVKVTMKQLPKILKRRGK